MNIEQIKYTIEQEKKKHPDLDWALIASIKIFNQINDNYKERNISVVDEWEDESDIDFNLNDDNYYFTIKDNIKI